MEKEHETHLVKHLGDNKLEEYAKTSEIQKKIINGNYMNPNNKITTKSQAHELTYFNGKKENSKMRTV